MPWPKIREIKEALTSFFSAPLTTKFPAVPETTDPAYRGRVKFDAGSCVGCGACAQVCPSGAISILDNAALGIRTVRVDHGSCIQCGQCAEHCITGRGVANTPFHAPALAAAGAPEAFEEIEKDLVLCENCGSPIGCRDHLLWIKDRLGPKAYAHPLLILLTQERLMGLDRDQAKPRLRREDQFLAVCPSCRRRIVAADEF